MNLSGLAKEVFLLAVGAALDHVLGVVPSVKAWTARRRMDKVLGCMYHDPLAFHPATKWSLDDLASHTGFSKQRLLETMEKAERQGLVGQRGRLQWRLTDKGAEYAEELPRPKKRCHKGTEVAQ